MLDQDWADIYTGLGLFETYDFRASAIKLAVNFSPVSTNTDSTTTTLVSYRAVKVPGGFVLQTLNINSGLTESSTFVTYIVTP